jgi:uncharacterized protein YjdB
MAVGKKLLSVFFSFTLAMGLLPYSAFADPSASSSDSTESSSDASTSNESEFADGGVASKPDPSNSEGGMDSSGSVSGGEDAEFGVGDEFANEQEMSAPDYSDGKLAIWADGLDDPSDIADVYPPDTNEIEAYANGSNLQPMSFSSEMLYFCKYESSCNYDQGLSSGDGYHAMGYFQFDNRYGLGSFLKAVYNYNPSTYSALKIIGDRYGWNVTGATRSNGAFTQLGNDLNTAWHAAYRANPTEFSNLQNGWAYIDSYNGSLGARGCLKAFGINLDNRPDCIKGLCWGMVNLFGAGGGASYINKGNYYGANWFFKNSGINDSMSDEVFVTTLCDYVVNNVAKRYPKQSIYWTGWQNRYKSEKADCLRYISEKKTNTLVEPDPSTYKIAYTSHVQDYGWQDWKTDGTSSGTSGQSKRLEGIKIKTGGSINGGVSYKTHVQDIGWQDWVQNGELAGTSGQSKRLEAIQIKLTGSAGDSFSVWYRVHAQDYGWLGWAKDGDSAGTEGLSKRLESIEVIALPKGQVPDDYDSSVGAMKKKTLSYSTHIQDYGTQTGFSDSVDEPITLGTTGEGKRLEGLTLQLDGDLSQLGISYGAHIQDIGWQEDRSNGSFAGTTGQSKRIEALHIALGDSSGYSIWYRAHVQDYGWLGWAKDGENAGTVGLSKRMEAIELVIMPKGQTPPGYDPSVDSAKTSILEYSSHISQIGTVSDVADNLCADIVLGTTGQSRHLEGFRLGISDSTESIGGSIEYRAHVQDIGWQDWQANSSFAGTSGKAKSIQAVEFKLDGEIAQKYDIFYRAHVSNIGWLDWTKNGDSAAGSVGCSIPIEAIEVAIVPKGSSDAPSVGATPLLDSSLFPSINCESQSAGWGWGKTSEGSVAGAIGQSRALVGMGLSVANDSAITGGISYLCHFANAGWTSWCGNGTRSTSSGNAIQAMRIELTGNLSNYFDVYYRTYVSGYGWMGWAKNGAASGTTGLNMNVEAYQVKVVAKGAPAPGVTAKSFSDSDGFLGMPPDRKAMRDRIIGYGSGTQWLIAVNRSTHKVGVFRGGAGSWSLQYYWSCVTGAPGSPTITGSYRTTGFKRPVLSTDSRARYCTQIWGGYFFHTILASESELGHSLSHGCLRMAYPSAQWIYNNINAGTAVVIYN